MKYKKRPLTEYLVGQIASAQSEIADIDTELEKQTRRNGVWAFLKVKQRKLKRYKRRCAHILNKREFSAPETEQSEFRDAVFK